MAEKTSAMTADPNVHHSRLCIEDLAGHHIQMRRCVVMNGGRSVKRDGHEGVIFDESPEADALSRWSRGSFRDVERAHARGWREGLAALDLEAMSAPFSSLLGRENRPRSLRDIKAMVDRLVGASAHAEAILGFALATLSVPYELWPMIYGRWQSEGRPPLKTFAPYAAHVLSVDMFFSIALALGHIAKARASNRADIAYLYYLPFCMVFTSMDKLHARAVPLFLNADQRFVWGADMKAELRRLDDHFSGYPDDVKLSGVMAFAQRPPTEGTFMTSRLWDELLSPNWREPRRPTTGPDATPEDMARNAQLVRELNAKIAESEPAGHDVHIDSAEFVVVERQIPIRVGKWRLVSPEVEKSSLDHAAGRGDGRTTT